MFTYCRAMRFTVFLYLSCLSNYEHIRLLHHLIKLKTVLLISPEFNRAGASDRVVPRGRVRPHAKRGSARDRCAGSSDAARGPLCCGFSSLTGWPISLIALLFACSFFANNVMRLGGRVKGGCRTGFVGIRTKEKNGCVCLWSVCNVGAFGTAVGVFFTTLC